MMNAAIAFGTKHDESIKKRHDVEELLQETETERLEERLHNVRRRCCCAAVQQQEEQILERDDKLRRLREDVAGVMDELHCFLLRNNHQHQEQSSDSITSNCENNNSNINNVVRGIDQWFQRSQDFAPISTIKWKKQLDFFQFCFYLKCNKPNIIQNKVVVVPAYDYVDHHFSDGRLRYLGNALLHNTTHIAELVAQVDIIFREKKKEIQRAAALIEFIRTSTSLRKVGIYKQKYVRPAGPEATRFSGLILDAITANPSIIELDISGTCPVHEFRRLMSTSSLRSLHIDCDNFATVTSNGHHTTRLLEALAINRSIDSLSFTLGCIGWVWFEAILRHMSNGGPAKVRKLTLVGDVTFPPSFYALMETTSQLHTLELNCYFRGGLCLDHQVMLRNALAINKSIENLKLVVKIEGEIVDTFLQSLHNGPSKLRTLTLTTLCNNFVALRDYLRCPTSTTLQYLVLEQSTVHQDRMNSLLQGLQPLDDDSRSTAMKHVAFKSCILCEKAMQGLAEFIAKYYNRQQRQPVSESLLVSEDPNLVAAMNFPLETTEYPKPLRTGDEMVVSMSATLLSSSSSGIIPSSYNRHGSTTHFISLSMRPHGRLPAYCDALMTTVETSSVVVCLQLSNVGSSDSVKLGRCLPRLTSLLALHLVDVQDDVQPSDITKGLQRNGSLLVTSFLKEGKIPFLQDKRDRIVVQAYCQRNRFLSELMGQKLTFCNICNVDVAIALNDGANRHCLGDKRTTNNNQLVLLPKLFRVANAIPLIISQFMLVALLELNATIAPQEGLDSD